ncbi:hypothetical protein OE88DRAFT_1222537 [Heliocybe sulcata]|uniref:Uncharacterized protein n=1 Tax=Heliocybe sulcata TaxID=5364 RepID=A0A5C3MJF1_9AGAM|nr:hypothetical protein OE88DRAFT_1222537 [Heliocybe sulcata]
MMASVNGIICASKLALRHWRDVRNSRHLVDVSGSVFQNWTLPYILFTNKVQKRWAFVPRALVHRGKHRVPKSDIPAPAPTRVRRPPALPVRTLDRTRLDVKDFVDFSGRIWRHVRFPLAPAERRLLMHYVYSDGWKIPFPPNSHGFLYWHLEPDAPPVSAQVRFRTTISSDPDTFPSGRDLQLPNGRTWNISLFRIARRSQYSGLRAHLLSEELVTERLLGIAANASAPSRRKRRNANYGIPATAATELCGPSAMLLRTLNPTRLAAEDFVDLTGRLMKTVHFPVGSEAPSYRLQMQYIRSGGHGYIPYPPESRGFFYWHLDQDAPPVTGQVRFRITTSSDPATFPSGRDLRLPDGDIWNISLLRIARYTRYSGLRAHLFSEELVAANVLDTAPNISASYQAHPLIPESDIPATTATELRRRSALSLRTLDQTRLNVEDFIDLSGRSQSTIRFPVVPEQPSFRMRYFYTGGRDIPFPPDCHGFFYWHLESDAPPVSGQIRFRATTSSDPATFPTGHDLQLPNCRVWHISLFEIARALKYSGLRAQLLSERLVTAMVLDTALKFSASYRARLLRPTTGSLLIWKFGQRFLVDLPSFEVPLWVIGNSAPERLLLPPLSSVWVHESDSSGFCYVLSESSDLRASAQAGNRDLVKGVDYAPFTGVSLQLFLS